jgi:hypothetical protein
MFSPNVNLAYTWGSLFRNKRGCDERIMAVYPQHEEQRKCLPNKASSEVIR